MRTVRNGTIRPRPKFSDPAHGTQRLQPRRPSGFAAPDVGGVRLRLEPPQLQALREDPWAMVRTSAVEALKLIEPAERAADVPRE